MTTGAGLTVASQLLVPKQCLAENDSPIFVFDDAGPFRQLIRKVRGQRRAPFGLR
jgi:hypothetical protein